MIDAAFGAVSEQVLTRRVLGSLGAGMLLPGGRNFPSYQLWRQATTTGAHLLWRVEASLRLLRIDTLTDGSYLARGRYCAPRIPRAWSRNCTPT